MKGKTPERKTILIVDDSFVNRELLKKIFSNEFNVEEAKNGIEAMETMQRLNSKISLVILDIMMPLLDGYGVMERMNNDDVLAQIPVIIITANEEEDIQIKALNYGAMDVITKPFNPKIVLHRVRNIVAHIDFIHTSEQNRMYKLRLQQQEELIKQAQTDIKTGLFNANTFYRKTSELLKQNPNQKFIIMRWDIDRFKVYNDMYGTVEGDRLLEHIGKLYKKNYQDKICGHIVADHFVSCAPIEEFNIYIVIETIKNWLTSYNAEFEFSPRFGIYIADDPKLDVALMCDRALLALRSTKGNIEKSYAYYQSSMRATLIEEQELISEMNNALSTGQFTVYLQPQYNYSSDTLYGAEALVRWQHPRKGLISPAKFIPVFENNGFICRLDEYVWEQTCILLRKWIDAGIKMVPVSVNISRRDIYNPHLCDIIVGIVKKYDLEPSLLRLEITESAYMENPAQLIKVVENLRESGFHIEMDDFGSGYSSLNTLKDVPVDTLKLDMKFLAQSEEGTRGGSILSSIVRMAHLLKLPVIAEGVETKQQADYLKSMGCLYMQGYYFAKPMPISDFETRLNETPIFSQQDTTYTIGINGSLDFLDSSIQSTLIFNNFLGGAAFIEYSSNDTIEALRFNDKFFEILGIKQEDYINKKVHILDKFCEEDKKTFIEMLNNAIENKKGVHNELCIKSSKTNSGKVWLDANVRLLDGNSYSYLFYVFISDITKSKEQTLELKKQQFLFQSLYNSIPCGIIQYVLKDNQCTLLNYNDTAWRIFKYASREEFENSINNDDDKCSVNNTYPDDLPLVINNMSLIMDSKNHIDFKHRIMCHNGDVHWVHTILQKVHSIDGEDIIQNVFADITDYEAHHPEASLIN